MFTVDYAELNAPPMINYGVVYPQAILIFTVTLLYSVVQPLILIFGAVYFGIAYVVYKYKLLFGKQAIPPAVLHYLMFVIAPQYSTSLMSPKAKPGPLLSSV